MTCEEALRKLYEVIDKEASDIDVQAVKEHLHNCKHCMSRYEFEEMFRTFVVEKTSTGLRTDRLRENILSSIDKAQEFPEGLFGGRFRYATVAIAAAAALIICIVAAFSLTNFYRYKTFAYPFEKHHLQQPANLVAGGPNGGELVEVMNFLVSDMNLALDNDPDRMKIVGGDLVDFNGHRFAHIRFINSNNDISLFLGRTDEADMSGFKKASASGIDYYWHICDDCQTICWKCGGVLAVAISQNKELDLTRLIPLIRLA